MRLGGDAPPGGGFAAPRRGGAAGGPAAPDPRRLLGRCIASVVLVASHGVSACEKPVYLTFDTGHMGVAPLVAEVLRRQQVKATFFLANEPTRSGGASLDDGWAAWWKARAAEGHAFGSHTWDHWVWRADDQPGFVVRPTAGPQAGRTLKVDAGAYCEALRRPLDRLQQLSGERGLPLFRAPAGRTSPALLKAAESCGFKHVPWTPAGFLGDELSSEAYPNASLLAKALREVKTGDILLAHLGIWSRRDPWAPAVLEPLIEGLKARGLCFATLREHPDYRAWIAAHPRP